MKNRIIQYIISAALLSISCAFGAQAGEEGFIPLFNGKDLTGWKGNPDLWTVRDGAITGETKPDTKLSHNTFLVYTNKEFSDFELRLSYKIVGGNSGVQYRSKYVQDGKFGPIVGGYQADIEAGKTFSGILYEERGRGILANRGEKVLIKTDPNNPSKFIREKTGELGKSEDIQAKIKSEDWNEYVIIAKGNRLQQFINGVQTIEVVDEDTPRAAKSGIIALQLHVGPAMTVQFKDIRIKPLN